MLKTTPQAADIFRGISCWDDLYKKISALPTAKDKGHSFEVFCKLFLEGSGEYKNVWLYDEIPHTTLNKLLLSGGDHGVDALVKTKNDKYLGVQCKWRADEAKKLSWLADKLTHIFAHQKLDGYIIFSNTSGVNAFTNQQIGNKLTTLFYADLESLTKADFENYRRILKKITPKEKQRHEPREDQEEAIKKVISGLKKADRGKLILPCGTGKTLISLWIKEKMKLKRTLVLVPSLSLLRQTKEVWIEQREKLFEYLCVCSEKDIDADNKNDMLKDVPSEIGFTGRGVLQDAEEIRTEIEDSNGDIVVFATYQSADKLKGIEFDLALCDEAHKTATKTNSTFSYIHNNKNIPCKKRIYMTATPRVTKDIKEGKGEKDNIIKYVADMNNETFFGEELHRMSFKEAIDKKILCDYKIILVETTEKNRNEIQQGGQISARSLLNIYNKAQKKYEIRKAITFHNSIKLAEQFKETLSKEKTNAYHINGNQNTSERSRILKEFAEHKNKSVITNARCLTEGIDMPTIDMVYFCGKRSSKVDIVQIIGRALRKAKGKRYGYVLLPIVHKKEQMESNDYEGEYKVVIGVLRAMQDQDERLADEIQLRFNKKLKQDKNNIIQGEIINVAQEITIKKRDIDPYILEKTTLSKFLPFKEAGEFVYSLNLKSSAEWAEYCKSGGKPDDIPAYPDGVYKDKGWVSWGDWLGTGTIASFNKKFRPFKKAREFIHSLNLKNQKEWGEYCKSGKKPGDIPANPYSIYKNKGWVNWGDWLGTGRVATQNIQYRSLKKAREFVHSLNLKGQAEWGEYSKSGKRPDDIPAHPDRTYKDKGWVNWGDWLGTGRVATQNMQYRSLKKAREFVNSLNLKNQKEWGEYCKSGKKPGDIPANPYSIYKNKGWVNWGDWLGTK